MSETRFVEMILEILRADRRYQEKMIEVLQEVRPEAWLAEGGSRENDRWPREGLAMGRDEGSGAERGELPFEAVAGIH
jgi:hypothetical protein